MMVLVGAMPPLFHVGLLLILSYLGGQVARVFKAPKVMGYLVMGMLLSPSVLGVLHERQVKEEFVVITYLALFIIAFSIGGSLEISKLKRLGKHILWITFTQAFGAFFLTTTALSAYFLFFHCRGDPWGCFWTVSFPPALVIGAICAATAPAATLAIVHEYRAKGPLTTTLLGVVALDDGLTIFLFAFAMAMAQSFIHLEALTFQSFFLAPALSLLVSLCIGGLMGIGIRALCRHVRTREALLGVMLGSIFLTGGLAETLHAHALLTNMMMGFVVVNYVRHHDDLFMVVEGIEEPLFGMFFALAGAHLDLTRFQSAGMLALVITLGRFAGKLMGSRVGARMSGAPEAVRKYLGPALLPTAGVTVGLVLEAGGAFGRSRLSEIMVNGVLGSVILNECLTPFLVRYSLKKSGEASA